MTGNSENRDYLVHRILVWQFRNIYVKPKRNNTTQFPHINLKIAPNVTNQYNLTNVRPRHSVENNYQVVCIL